MEKFDASGTVDWAAFLEDCKSFGDVFEKHAVTEYQVYSLLMAVAMNLLMPMQVRTGCLELMQTHNHMRSVLRDMDLHIGGAHAEHIAPFSAEQLHEVFEQMITDMTGNKGEAHD